MVHGKKLSPAEIPDPFDQYPRFMLVMESSFTFTLICFFSGFMFFSESESRNYLLCDEKGKGIN